MPVVVDAALAFGWLVKEERTPQIIRLGREIMKEGAIAPQYFFLEVANALSMAERRKRFGAQTTEALIDRLRRFPIVVSPIDIPERLGGIVELARKHRLTVYDALYLELAQRRGATLATLDADLRRAAAAIGVQVLP